MIAALMPVIWLGAAFLALFGIAELLHRSLRVPAEHTRSIVHAGTGLLTLLFPVCLRELWQVVILCGSFLLLLLASMRFGWLPSINGVERRSQGSWLYPVVVVMCFRYMQVMGAGPSPLFDTYYYFALPLLLLAICDPAAALAGRAFRARRPGTAPGKTFAGSFSFLILASAIAIAAAFTCTRGSIPSRYFVATAIATAYAATLAERLSSGGWDNFTIPVVTIACMAATDYVL